MFGIQLIINSVLLGIGLAMDAFSVSIANGIADPAMRKRRIMLIAGTFAAFQFVMPLGGWVCVHFVAKQFTMVSAGNPVHRICPAAAHRRKYGARGFRKEQP